MTTLPPGFTPASPDPAEERIGPFFRNKDLRQTGLVALPDHCNDGNIIHGGVLMTLADYTLSALALWECAGESVVTISLNCDFMAAGRAGHWINGEGQVLKKTGSMVFVQGQLKQAENCLLSFTGVVKRLQKRD